MVFADEAIRILDLRMAPGDTSAYHIHSDAIAYIGLDGSQVWLDVPGLESRNVNLPDDFWGGDTEYSEAPFVHRIANVGKQAFRILAVEHLEQRTRHVFPDGYLAGWVSLDVNPYFLIHRRMVQPGEVIEETIHGAFLLVGRGTGETQVTRESMTVSLGHGDWIYGKTEHEHIRLSNNSRQPLELLFIHF